MLRIALVGIAEEGRSGLRSLGERVIGAIVHAEGAQAGAREGEGHRAAGRRVVVGRDDPA